MVFSFQVLGLVIIFVLICLYYIKDIKKSKEVSIFRGILLTSYILELLYISVYISMRTDSSVLFFSKLYLSLCTIYYSLLLAYFLSNGLKDKYITKETIYNDKINRAGRTLLIADIFSIFLIFLSPLKWDYYIISSYAVAITHIIQIIYIFLIGHTLYKYNQYINVRKNSCLLIIFFVMIITLIIELTLWNLPVTNSSIIVTTLILYLTLENPSVKEISKLKIERDYAVNKNTERKKFLTDMSHEIRTPLNTIEGFSQVITSSDNLTSIKEDAEDIRIASRNLIDIINGMIDISMIESGKLEITNENYNVYDMFDNIIDITNSKLKDSNVKFLTKIDKNIPKVLNGDAERLEQVILNILMNSIKYTEKGTIELEVDSVKATTKCRLKIKVSDTGIGIKEENLNKIFSNINYDSLSKESYSLGLTVSKQLLDLMEGEIDVDSTYGKGSVFTITIDQKIADSDAVAERRERNVQPFSAKGSRVLVVDDNKLNIKVATKLLSQYDIEVEAVYSGRECLDLLDKDTNFDLILMDDMMPHMSGTETLDILRKIERVEGFQIPVVVLTANAINGMKTKYLSCGFDDYLAKPIDRQELNRILKKFLQKE